MDIHRAAEIHSDNESIQSFVLTRNPFDLDEHGINEIQLQNALQLNQLPDKPLHQLVYADKDSKSKSVGGTRPKTVHWSNDTRLKTASSAKSRSTQSRGQSRSSGRKSTTRLVLEIPRVEKEHMQEEEDKVQEAIEEQSQIVSVKTEEQDKVFNELVMTTIQARINSALYRTFTAKSNSSIENQVKRLEASLVSRANTSHKKKWRMKPPVVQVEFPTKEDERSTKVWLHKLVDVDSIQDDEPLETNQTLDLDALQQIKLKQQEIKHCKIGTRSLTKKVQFPIPTKIINHKDETEEVNFKSEKETQESTINLDSVKIPNSSLKQIISQDLKKPSFWKYETPLHPNLNPHFDYKSPHQTKKRHGPRILWSLDEEEHPYHPSQTVHTDIVSSNQSVGVPDIKIKRPLTTVNLNNPSCKPHQIEYSGTSLIIQSSGWDEEILDEPINDEFLLNVTDEDPIPARPIEMTHDKHLDKIHDLAIPHSHLPVNKDLDLMTYGINVFTMASLNPQSKIKKSNESIIPIKSSPTNKQRKKSIYHYKTSSRRNSAKKSNKFRSNSTELSESEVSIPFQEIVSSIQFYFELGWRVIRIQSLVRMYLERKRYIHTQDVVRLCQRMYRSHRVYKEYKNLKNSQSKDKTRLVTLYQSAKIHGNGDWLVDNPWIQKAHKTVFDPIRYRLFRQNSKKQELIIQKQDLFRMRLFEKTTEFLKLNYSKQWNELGNEKRRAMDLKHLYLLKDYCQLNTR